MANYHKQGEIYYANINQSSSPNIQKGIRPVIIIQNNVGNKFSPTVTVIPLTSKKKSMHMPTHVLIEVDESNELQCSSVALGEQMTTIPVSCLKNKIGKLKDDDLKKTWNAAINQISLSSS